jgi:hypothetical protein
VQLVVRCFSGIENKIATEIRINRVFFTHKKSFESHTLSSSTYESHFRCSAATKQQSRTERQRQCQARLEPELELEPGQLQHREEHFLTVLASQENGKKVSAPVQLKQTRTLDRHFLLALVFQVGHHAELRGAVGTPLLRRGFRFGKRCRSGPNENPSFPDSDSNETSN